MMGRNRLSDDAEILKQFENPQFREWYERERQGDATSRYNDYLGRRSYEGMDDPFMHYYNSLEGRHNFQRELQPLDPETQRHLENYMELRKRQFGVKPAPGS